MPIARMLRRTFVMAAIGWAVALPFAAWMAARDPDSAPLSALAAGVYGLAGFLCHQQPARSFTLGSEILPVCARCTGLYVGGALGAMLTPAVVRWRVSQGFLRTALLASIAPTVITVAWEWGTGQMPDAWIRAVAGFTIGLPVAWTVLSATLPEVN